MAESPATCIHRAWKILAVALVLLMLAIILAVPRLHVRADRRACLTRIQAFATAMQLHEAEVALRGAGPSVSLAEDTERDRIAERYFCPTTKGAYVFLGQADTETTEQAEQIIAYEPLTDQHGVGGCVVYADGRATFLSSDRYHAEVD